MTTRWIFILFLCVPFYSFAAPLNQNDVSILFPLPSKLAEDRLFRPTTKGAQGELLPLAIYMRMPDVLNSSSEQTYKSLRVVGLRLDPCFTGQPPVLCQAQIRMVWQPLFLTSDGSLSTLDAAVHSFYNLNEAEFQELIKQLENLKDRYGLTNTNEILGVHPELQKHGLTSPYATELMSLLLARVGASRLSQATFMETTGGGNIWIFGGFRIYGTQVSQIAIPRISSFTQTFVNNALPSRDYFRGGITPEPRGADVFNGILKDSSSLQPSDEKQITEATLAAVRVENPHFHDTMTMDCASCHTAQPARVWGLIRNPALQAQAEALKYSSKYNLINSSPRPGNTMMVRAFGYDLQLPAISQRSINETAAILEKLYP